MVRMNHGNHDSVYLNGECTLGTISLQVDLHLCSFSTGCDQTVAQFLQSITAVGDQLPDKNLVESERRITDQSHFLRCGLFLSQTPTSFSEYNDRATISSNFFVSA